MNAFIEYCKGARRQISLLVLTCIVIGWMQENVTAQSSSLKPNGRRAASIARMSDKRRLSPQQLTTQAEFIVVGKVSALHSSWNNDRTRIYTEVTIDVNEYVKGVQQQQSLTIQHMGGEVGTEGEMYSHVAKFQQDEDVMVFAGKDSEGKLQIIGGDQGKLNVTVNSATGKKMVSSSVLLDDFKAQVKGYMKGKQ